MNVIAPPRKLIKIVVLAAAVALISTHVAGCSNNQDNIWRSKLTSELSVLGHRNWIVVADSAYPAQSRSGIETIATGADHIEVVEAVLKAVDQASHVRANVYLDKELIYLTKEEVGPIAAYGKQLNELLGQKEVNYVVHEEIIRKLDEAAKTFRVLILKTDLTLPYTSVFLELDCGYWSPEAEAKLRKAIRQAGN